MAGPCDRHSELLGLVKCGGILEELLAFEGLFSVELVMEGLIHEL